MKTNVILFSLTLVAAALAGCADNDAADANATPTGTTPATMTPATTTPMTTPTMPGEGEMPAPDPRCLAPPANATAPAAGTRLGMPELSFTTSDPTEDDPCFRFHGPQNATSGWNAFSLTYPQGGRTFHIMPMYFIGDHTMAELQAALMAGPDAQPPEWAVPSGAVGGVTSGQTGRVAIDLEVGNYVYFCPIDGHMMQGMMGMLSVTQADNESAAPDADATIELTDYNFTVPALHEDVAVIAVTNNGTEPHEAPLVRLNAGANMTTFLAAIESETPTGPPPGALVGGVNAIAPGQTVYLLVDLAPETSYGLVCFVSSPSHGGAPHIAIGPMLAEFDVEHSGDTH